MPAVDTRLEKPLAGSAAACSAVPLGMRSGVNTIDIPIMPKGIRLKPSYTTWDESYHSPRHRHTFDQVRYLLTGRQKVGTRTLAASDLLYVPEGQHYGPQRTDDDPQTGRVSTHLSIQIPGAGNGIYLPIEEQRAAVAALSKVGVFKDGMYVRDGRSMDAFEATHQQATGSMPVYPPARVDAPIIFHTAAIPWHPVPGIKGLSVRQVAHLYDFGPSIKMIKLDPGAEVPASNGQWEEVRFVVEGEIALDGSSYPAPSGFYRPGYLSFSPMSTKTGATLLLVQIGRSLEAAPPLFAP
jgi:hypothetical protein